MKEVKCPKCNIKLGEINEKKMTVSYENGITPFLISCSSGSIVFHFECPECGESHNYTIPV